ncbi:hypothetical protein KSP39_PZI020467 [Platanthera zijinensis]|uniref:Uncharacterized protein n=1 Tax=Platanthera zijinensis TaxID=2320716 RepID=A0AAP0FX51_9ASPA
MTEMSNYDNGILTGVGRAITVVVTGGTEKVQTPERMRSFAREICDSREIVVDAGVDESLKCPSGEGANAGAGEDESLKS